MTAALQIDGIGKSYGTRRVVDGLTFGVRAGELFGFVGGNGAGKTTTMRIILGVLAPDAGRVCWQGRPISFATRRRIGYMPEERGLYPRMKAAEQLRYFGELHGMTPAAARAAARGWLERLDVAGYADAEVQSLSLGNQQRVQLAAALVHDPVALVLDEPFSGLDPVAVDVMSDVLRQTAAAGVPVVFSSHQLSLVEGLCDRVGIIADGRLVACGTVGELGGPAGDSLVVDVRGAPEGWADALPGVRVLGREGSSVRLGLADPGDDQRVLRAALAAGRVASFAWERRSLAEVFRDTAGRRTAGAAAGGGA
ncbi:MULTISPECIES: ABC transporter ATP-binding protein [Streptomyces]|uniref:ABC transporter ATP-binding protein n=1 Tax=Streptomyces TaxID=1883 RepID=UPI001D1424D3|nr:MULTISPECIES: ATP-binding cassette domain-containing protein [Streptomyces]MCC3651245.1 ATP-binding cassette domain-containing protein [Streptomyces sp. S07_1.15]WSQ73940.1 ATP-binding cassette domain-containing protein [Streptomyces xinghaiensis]